MVFQDRIEAGKLLVQRLYKLKSLQSVLVLGIPRGGVVVASEIAKGLALPLDIVITRKIGAPGQRELSMGAVDPLGEVFWEEELLERMHLTKERLKDEVDAQLVEIKRRAVKYRDRGWKLGIRG